MAMLDERVAAAVTSDVATPDEQVASIESTSEIQRLVAELPPRQQEVLRLKFEHGLKYREIADVMGLSATNVGFLLHTALATLRTQLGDTIDRSDDTERPRGSGTFFGRGVLGEREDLQAEK